MNCDRQILTVAEMVAAENALIAAGVSVDELMQRAGNGAAEWVWRLSGGRPVTVLCGPGNNGGDGYVIAEAIRRKGGAVTVIAPVEPRTDAARRARDAYSGGVLGPDERPQGDVFVDCLFGSGLTRALDDDALALLLALADLHRHRIAIDLPSGVNSDTGEALNENLPAYDCTLSLGAWKYAHWLMPGASRMGERRLVPIGVAEGSDSAMVLARPHLEPPAPDAHKYSRGLLAVVEGAMPGAALLACRAAMHGGAGYVKLLAPRPSLLAPLDLVVDSQPLADALADRRIATVLAGPGLGRQMAARKCLETALARHGPLVLDADALAMVTPELLALHDGPVVATPHEGELAALAQSFGIVCKGKLELARRLAAETGMVVLAKGPDSIIAAPDGRTIIAPAASSWLSVAGTGDVLAGLLASRLAAGRAPFDAAADALWIHGEAARLAGPAFSASGLADAIPAAMVSVL